MVKSSQQKLGINQVIHSVVMLGAFNPRIFHPSWFAHNEIVPPEESREAKINFMSEEVSSFSFSGLSFQIESNRFGVTTKDESQAPFLRDICIAIFTLLEHTPIRALGLNCDLEFSLPNKESWDEVGHKLAPKECWQSILSDPGMKSISIQGGRDGTKADRVTFQVHPTTSEDGYGVFVKVNQHYDLDIDQSEPTTEQLKLALHYLRDDFQSLRTYARKSAEAIVSPERNDS